MKRRKTLFAADNNTKATIEIRLNCAAGGLVRSEQDHLIEQISSGIMQVLADAKYLHVHLSEIRVGRQ